MSEGLVWVCIVVRGDGCWGMGAESKEEKVDRMEGQGVRVLLAEGGDGQERAQGEEE